MDNACRNIHKHLAHHTYVNNSLIMGSIGTWAQHEHITQTQLQYRHMVKVVRGHVMVHHNTHHEESESDKVVEEEYEEEKEHKEEGQIC